MLRPVLLVGLLAGVAVGQAVDRHGDPLPAGAVARLGTVRYRTDSDAAWLACLPDGKTGVTATLEGGVEGRVALWNLATGRTFRRLVGPPIEAVALSGDGKRLVALCWNHDARQNRIYHWDLTTGKVRHLQVANGTNAAAIALAPDGTTLAVAGADGSLRLWNLAAEAEARAFPPAESAWSRLAFSPDGKLLATGTHGMSTLIRVREVGTGKARHTLRAPDDFLSTLTFFPRTNLLASVSRRTVRFWDTDTGKLRREITTGSINRGLAFSPDGQTLATGDDSGVWSEGAHYSERLWDVATGKEVREFAPRPTPIKAVAFTPDGGKLVSLGDPAVLRVHDLKTGTELSVVPAAHHAALSSLAFSPDGRTVATAGEDGGIRLWEAATGKPVRALPEVRRRAILRVAFAPDGRTLAAGSLQGVRFWDVATGKYAGQLPAGTSSDDNLVAYSPDGRLLATGPRDLHPGELRFWDVATNREVKPALPLPTTGLLPQAFSPWRATRAACSTCPATPSRPAPGVRWRTPPTADSSPTGRRPAPSSCGRSPPGGSGGGWPGTWDRWGSWRSRPTARSWRRRVPTLPASSGTCRGSSARSAGGRCRTSCWSSTGPRWLGTPWPPTWRWSCWRRRRRTRCRS